MNPVLGWALAAGFAAASWAAYGWQGLAFAATGIVFWLLLQFNRTIRVMKNAAGRPLGHVPSAVMLNARLRRGLTMLDVVTMTKSLGERADAARDDEWLWRDAGGSAVRLHFAGPKLDRWSLERPDERAET